MVAAKNTKVTTTGKLGKEDTFFAIKRRFEKISNIKRQSDGPAVVHGRQGTK